MNFLDEVRTKRQKLADILSDDDYSGIRDIVEELYPDRAHFIYELLQNAEDTGASKASFWLEENSVNFEHNGRPFSKDNVWGITNIGKGTKKDQEDQIGRFGVGFKAVFAYSETPHIWSPTFCFKISELVLPTEIHARPDLGQQTRFEFPFNSLKKTAQDAYAEIEAGLNELAETTLLFLSHLNSIRWQIGQNSSGEVLRIQHSENHIEVLKKVDGKTAASSHFLRFSEPVKDLDKQSVSIAFALDCLPNITAFENGKPLAKQVKIVPSNPGRVAVFFPAEKETSGLRFHLHAPFVPELSRASIKETTANNPLFKQLASLAAASLHFIRDQNLLTGDFLGVLPNPLDTIPTRYQPIRAAILTEMNEQSLTPTHSKSHAPAKHLLQAKASLKELLAPEDIEFLFEYEDEPPQWAIGASQKNSNADRFLSGLAITDWDISQFADVLVRKAQVGSGASPGEDFVKWISAKPIEWHQQMYSLLYKELSPGDEIHRLKNVQFVRLSDGSYSVGTRCYFPSDGAEHDEMFPRVAIGTYSSGRSKAQQEEAQKLLAGIGVREVRELDQVQAILKQRYTLEAAVPSEKEYLRDLKRFIALTAKEPESAKLFADFYIFERAREDWSQPSGVFLDVPFLETGLSAYYQAIGDNALRAALAPRYEQCGIPLEKIRIFAEAVGVQKRLVIELTSCRNNPNWIYLCCVPGERYTSPIDRDYAIPQLDNLLLRPSIELSRLVWQTMCSLPRHANGFQATYRKNEANGSRSTDSQLICLLKNTAWVPQSSGTFVRPSDAARALLPKGFPFDEGYEWLRLVRFGEKNWQVVEESQTKDSAAKKMGFPDASSLERAKRFATLPHEEQERVLAEFQRRHSQELPEHEPHDPERRAKNVRKQAADAPERVTEERTRSVSVGLDEVKKQSEPYLREQYTIADGDMICQACKAQLPFKLEDGVWFFEKVEFLPKLIKRHYQNYLALCPNHAAMFQHANGSEDSIRQLFLGLEGNELDVVLAQQDITIYFTKTHIADLKAVIEAEQTGTKS